jgi:hypothetical protein
LAERAALFGALPAAAAFALRRAAPGAAAALAPDLRGAAVLALAAIGLCAGGTLSATLAAVGAAGGGVVLALAVAAQATAAGAAWSTGRLARGADREGFGGRPLLVVGVARNAGFVWAAAAGGLTVRGEAVLALASCNPPIASGHWWTSRSSIGISPASPISTPPSQGVAAASTPRPSDRTPTFTGGPDPRSRTDHRDLV